MRDHTVFTQKSSTNMMLNQALFLVQLGAWSVHLSDNVGHSCLEKVENDASQGHGWKPGHWSVLVAHEGSEVGLLGCIVLRKALDLAVMMPWLQNRHDAQSQ